MIRQAHTYLAGAVSGSALVAAAVVAFVLLVSFQALRDWPLAGISIGGDDSAATGAANPGGGSPASSVRAGVSAATGPAVAKGATRADGTHSTAKQDNQVVLDASPTGTAGSPTAEAPSSSPIGQGGSASAPSDSSLSGSGSSRPAPREGGGGSGTGSSAGGSSQSTSGAITDTVNKTVSGVDEATGGVVGSTGVTEVTEKTVENVAGPESTVGHTGDEAVKTVGGLLGGNK
jgi:type IV secretion system protein TrbL